MAERGRNYKAETSRCCVPTADPNVVRGKNILFIAANFFNLPAEITRELERLGANVHYYDERPNNSVLTKTLIRLNRNLLSHKVNKYYDQIIEQTRDMKLDYVFIIKGECISANSLRRLHQLHPNAQFILYQWDSVAYNKQFNTIRPYFDHLLSFDRFDCQEYGMDFLPLFYTNECKAIGDSEQQPQYDLFFVGTVHFDRYQFIRSIVNQVRGFGGKVFTYLYFPHRLLFLKKKYIDRGLQGEQIDDFKFTPMPYSQLLSLYGQSRIAVDMQKPRQRGLTFRCPEALGTHRKLITTNQDIVNYNFYDPANILVVDRNNPVVTREFFESAYRPVEKSVLDSYSIANWIGNIFRPIPKK